MYVRHMVQLELIFVEGTYRAASWMMAEFDIEGTNQAQTMALSAAELTMSAYYKSCYLIDIKGNQSDDMRNQRLS